MGVLQELAGRVEEVAAAGGKFVDSFVRTAGFTMSRALEFVDREIGYAQRLRKKTGDAKARDRKERDRES